MNRLFVQFPMQLNFERHNSTAYVNSLWLFFLVNSTEIKHFSLVEIIKNSSTRTQQYHLAVQSAINAAQSGYFVC